MEYGTYGTKQTGFDDSYVWTVYKRQWSKSSVERWLRTLLIALIPFPGVGSVQPHILIPLVFYLYLRNFTIIAFLILLWIIVEFFAYSLFGVWDFGAYFNLNYRKIWIKKLRGEGYIVREEKYEKDTGDESPPSEEYEGEEEQGEDEEDLGLREYTEDRGRGRVIIVPDTPDLVGVVITNLLYNLIFEIIGVLIVFYAVRGFPLDTFGFGDKFTWELAIQMVIVYIAMSFHGAITSWISTLFLTVMIWGVFAPWNTNGYQDFTLYVAGPYIFWSVVNIFFTIVFSRIYVRCGNTSIYPWPTDRRYIINAASGIGLAFWILSLIFTIKNE